MVELNSEEKSLIVLAAAEIARTARTEYYDWYKEQSSGHTTNSNNYFYDDRVLPGEVVVITNITAGTSAVSTTVVSMYVDDGVSKRPIYSASQGTSLIYVGWQGQIMLRPGHRLCVDVKNTNASTDTIKVFATGYRLKV